MYVYLAGPMGGNWRVAFVEKLKEHGHIPLIPEDASSDLAEVVHDDYNLIKKSDLVIAVLDDGAPRIGTSMEIMLAYDLNKPVVSVYQKTHPWVYSFSNVVCSTVEGLLDGFDELMTLFEDGCFEGFEKPYVEYIENEIKNKEYKRLVEEHEQND